MKYSSCVCAITAGASLIIVYLSSPTWIGDPTTVASLVAFKIGWPHHLQAAAGLEKTRLHNYMMGPSAVDYEPKVDPSDGKLWTYRLGDVYGSPAFKIEFTNELRAKTISLFSTTIAARYARRVTPGKKSDAPLLTNVTLTWCDKNLPHNFFSKYERVVHLRLGDALIHPSPQFSPDPPNVFALKYWYAINQRPALQKDISRSRVAQRHPLKTIIIYGDHKGKHLDDSLLFAQKVAKLINATLAFSGFADGDFCRMVSAREFVMGKGGFSNTVKDVREVLGRKTIQPRTEN